MTLKKMNKRANKQTNKQEIAHKYRKLYIVLAMDRNEPERRIDKK